MARKRMLSPDIWESESFSSLSDLAKIVFISLISHADDEGRGKASAGYVKSMTFPYDEGRRVTDVAKALSEIAQSMSVCFYAVNGSDYYCLTNWAAWQKIDKPSRSKLPAPPTSGVGGLLSESEENQKFGEGSANTSRMFGEGSPPNRIEENRIEENINSAVIARARTCEKSLYDEFCKKYGKSLVDEYIRKIDEYKKAHPKARLDYEKTIPKWIEEDKAKLVKPRSGQISAQKTYTSEQLNALTEDLNYDDL